MVMAELRVQKSLVSLVSSPNKNNDQDGLL